MAVSALTKSSSGGVASRVTGYATTDAVAAAATSFVVGFTPTRIAFHNVTDRISDEWLTGMASASSIHTVAAGTRTLETTNGIAVGIVTDSFTGATGMGFTVTATTMVASKSFAWEAVG